MKNTHFNLLTLSVLILLAGCSQKPVSNVDTPENHFSAGMRLLDEENYTGAIASFERALDLDKKFAPAYGGLAIANAYLGKPNRAEYYIQEALNRAGKDPAVLTLGGRAWLAMKDQKKNWYKKATQLLDKAVKIDKNHDAALYYSGLARFYNYEFAAAESFFSKAVSQKGDYSGKADSKWQLTQKIVRAMPGTEAGQKVAVQETITRADLAVLFIEELKIGELMAKMPQPGQGFQTPDQMNAAGQGLTADDINGHWAEVWIRDALNYNVIEMQGDGKFYPDETVTRAGFAMAVQRLLVTATRDFSLETRYFGESPSRFADVPSSHPAYNAMALCVERGIMQADVMTGNFNPTGAVTGADALLIIRTLQNNLRMTF
ncbi:MAG: S-layer homology domain-containing protein [Fidelibacterota bacterium]